MNPRVDALNDFRNGNLKSSKASFTNLKEHLTEHDKKIKKIVWCYVSLLTIIFAYYTFYDQKFSAYSNMS